MNPILLFPLLLPLLSPSFAKPAYITLKPGIPYTDTISSNKLHYFQIETQFQNNKPLDLQITSSPLNITQGVNPPFMIVSNKPFPHSDKRAHWVCGKVTPEMKCVVPHSFYGRHIYKLYIAVHGNDNTYVIIPNFIEPNITNNNEHITYQNTIRSSTNTQQLRLLQETATETTNQTGETYNANKLTALEPLKRIEGAGVAAIFILLFFVFTVAISSYILMNIFVNTKLIKQPLKLGKVEA